MVDNPRIQILKEKLSAFIFHTTWRKGKDHVIPDALSRAPCRDPEDKLILLNSHRIVVPVQKRKKILTKPHASHQGIERTKQRAHQIAYWPAINSDIKIPLRSARNAKSTSQACNRNHCNVEST